MFTGLVSAVGRLSSLQDGRLRVTFDPAWTEGDPLVAGESVAVNGCCLTTVAWGPGWADFELSEETFRRTTFSSHSPSPREGEVAPRSGDGGGQPPTSQTRPPSPSFHSGTPPCKQGGELGEVFPSPGSQEKVPCDSKGDEVDSPELAVPLTPALSPLGGEGASSSSPREGEDLPLLLLNLERAAKVGDRLGGHIVQGHIDGVGTVVGVEVRGEYSVLTFQLPPEADKLLIDKGSVALDGVSLTVVNPQEARFECWIIPHTLANTNLHSKRAGDRVSFELDCLAKHVEKLLSPR